MFFKMPDFANRDCFSWPTFVVIGSFHVLSLLALTTFSWEGFALFMVLNILTGSVGISFCYHRLLTHGSFKTNKFIKYFGVLCGILSLEGGPIFWVSTHRYHHKKSDQPGDPHSPRDGAFWAHIGWLMFKHPFLDQKNNGEERRKIVSDLYADPVIAFLEAYNFPIAVSSLVALYVAGFLYAGPEMALSFLIWGGIFRVVYVWNVTWLVNSATHMWGYTNYETREDSKNHPVFAMLTYGEGWHNNHHGEQRSASFWHRWFEFDQTYAIIWVLEKLGLVSDVVKPSYKKPKLPPKQGLTPA